MAQKYEVLKGCSVEGKRLVEGAIVDIPEGKVGRLVSMGRIREAVEAPKPAAKPKAKAKAKKDSEK